MIVVIGGSLNTISLIIILIVILILIMNRVVYLVAWTSGSNHVMVLTCPSSI